MRIPYTNCLPILTTFFFIGLFMTSNAQPHPIKWGKVPSEDLVMTTYDTDLDADAVILCDYEQVTVEFVAQNPVSYEIHTRIKILTQEGLDYANIKIPYHKKENIISFQAHTINQGGISKVNKKDVFDEKASDNYRRRRFTFPNVQVGSVIEYRYTLKSPVVHVLDTWYFQRDIPTRHSECRFMIPEFIEYVVLSNTDRTFDIKEEKRAKVGNMDGYMYRMVMENVSGRKEEEYITTMRDYYNNVQFQTSEINVPGFYVKKYWKDWPDLIETWWDNDAGGKQLKSRINHKKILQDAEAATKGISDTKAKAVALYNFIKDSYTWSGQFHDYASEKKLSAAYEKSTGNSADINMSLIACLRDAGIEAHPVRISTRSHGKIQKVYPIVSQFNHIVAIAKIDNKDYLLDAIDKDLTFGMLHSQSLSLQGLLLKPTKELQPTWIDLIPSKTIEVVNINLQLENDEPTAELTGVYTGYRAWNKRYQHRKKDEDDYIEERLGDLYDFEVESVEFNTEKPERFAEVIELKVEDAITLSADYIYISPFLMEQTEERLFTTEKREYPVDIAYPYEEKYILNLMIPEGYEVAEAPQNIRITLPDASGEYLYMIKTKNNILQLRCEESLKKPIYLPEEYETLKALFDLIFEKEAEQIILKKK